MQKMRFSLSISAEQYQSYYRGSARFVKVQADDGRSLKFPASELQQFILHDGIQGRFEIVFDNQHKMVSLTKL